MIKTLLLLSACALSPMLEENTPEIVKPTLEVGTFEHASIELHVVRGEKGEEVLNKEYEVGDIVSFIFTIEEDFKMKDNSLKIGETEQTYSVKEIENEDASISTLFYFDMRENTNYVISADFVTKIDVNDAFQVWLAQWFSPSTIATIMSWIAYAGTIIALATNLRRIIKEKHSSNESLRDDILAELKNTIGSEVSEKLKPGIDSLITTCENQQKVLQVLTKITALAQENTPESRLAILECIASLGVIDKKVVETAQESIKEEVETDSKQKEETKEKVNAIIDDGTNI